MTSLKISTAPTEQPPTSEDKEERLKRNLRKKEISLHYIHGQGPEVQIKQKKK
jgi:hypothetical protein